jgi:hypothetical protein
VYTVYQSASQVNAVLLRLNGHGGWKVVRNQLPYPSNLSAVHFVNGVVDWRVQVDYTQPKTVQLCVTNAAIPISKKLTPETRTDQYGMPMPPSPTWGKPQRIEPDMLATKAPFSFLLPSQWPKGYRLDHAWKNSVSGLSNTQVDPLQLICLVAKNSQGHRILLLEGQEQSLNQVFPPLHAPAGSTVSPFRERSKMMLFSMGLGAEGFPDWKGIPLMPNYLDATKGLSYVLVSDKLSDVEDFGPALDSAPIVQAAKT